MENHSKSPCQVNPKWGHKESDMNATARTPTYSGRTAVQALRSAFLKGKELLRGQQSTLIKHKYHLLSSGEKVSTLNFRENINREIETNRQGFQLSDHKQYMHHRSTDRSNSLIIHT